MKSKRYSPKSGKATKSLKKQFRNPSIAKVITRLRADFELSELATEQALKEISDELKNIVLDMSQMKIKSEESSLNSKISTSIKTEIEKKSLSAQRLIEEYKLLREQLPLNNNNWSHLEYQSKLNLVLDKVNIKAGDALCSTNVVIEGSQAVSQQIDVGSKKEMYFVSLLHLLETCVLHERIWLSGGREKNEIKETDFHYGYFSQILQSEGILQPYTGIINLIDAETVKKREGLYSVYSEKKDKSEEIISDIAFAETARLKYIPDSNKAISFHLFTQEIEKKIYQPLVNNIYNSMQGSLSSPFNEIEKFIFTEEVFIPPISAIILSRASKFDDIPEVMLETRKKFSTTRTALMEYEDALRDTSVSLKKRLKILSDINLMNQELAKPYDYLDSLYINEWADLWNIVNDLFDGELTVSKLTGKILGKPIAKAIKNIRLRNVAYLFNMRRKIYSLSSHNNLAGKFLPNVNLERLNYYLNLYGKPTANIQNKQEAG